MKQSGLHKKEGLFTLLFLFPHFSGYILFFLFPFLWGIYYSLVDNVFTAKFSGLANYISVFRSGSFQLAWVNTLLFICICVPLSLLISLGLSLLLNKQLFKRNVFRTLFIIPLVTPVASIVLFWQIVFQSKGWLNYLIPLCGGDNIDWLNSGWSMGVVVLMYLWKNIGYNVVLLLAGLQNIPVQYYESAAIDGAGRWRILRSITLTYLTPALFFTFIISIINGFKVFREVYLLYGDYPNRSVYMLQHYMNNVFTVLDYQKLTSAAMIIALLIYLLVLCLFHFERKISNRLV